MDINNDLLAVQQRIAQITGADVPQPTATDGTASFAALVQAELHAHGIEAPDQAVAGPDASANARAPVPSEEIERLVSANGATWNVDPSLIKAIIANESGFDAGATSHAGAQGLMQLMPGTASGLGVTDAYDPAQNVWGGTRYMRGLLDRFGGNVELAVAAYNAGPGAVEKYSGVPPYAETQNYVQNVLASYQRYKSEAPR